MPFNITCVRCGGKIATVEKDKVRDWVQTHDIEVCKGCVDKEDALRAFFDKQKNGYIKKLNAVCEQAVTDLNEKIKEIHVEHRPVN